MYVEELTKLHSLIALWKMVHSGKPSQLVEKWEISEDRTLTTRRPRLKTTEAYFKWRTISQWNVLPQSLRENGKLSYFKKQLMRLIVESRTDTTYQENQSEDRTGHDSSNGGQNGPDTEHDGTLTGGGQGQHTAGGQEDDENDTQD